MSKNSNILPTTRETGTTRDELVVHPDYILHPDYLVGLLPLENGVNNLTEGVNPFYKGDIYNEQLTPEARRWESETTSADEYPYLNKIRQWKTAFPDLAYLASWMEVTTSVRRAKYLSRRPAAERERRANRVRVCGVDLKKGAKPMQKHYEDKDSLAKGLAPESIAANTSDASIYIVEDLSRAVIESLGSAFNVDPLFFRNHVDDYLWSPVVTEALELRNLDFVTQKRSHLCLRYLRPRYYRDTAAFVSAIRQTAEFNVLRQLDSDRSRQGNKDTKGGAAALMRAKTSLWVKPNKPGETRVVAILLVDPTPAAGDRLWKGYTSFDGWPTDEPETRPSEPPRTSLYRDVIYWMTRMSDSDVDAIVEEPKACALPALWLILSDWHHVIQYVTAQLGRIEWEIEEPALRENGTGIDATMKRLHPWRRNVALYRAMVAASINVLFSKKVRRQCEQAAADPDSGLAALLPDFNIVLKDMDDIQTRIERIVPVASALLSVEDGRRAIDQNTNVARLTYLATVFIPLSFVCGLLSMQTDIARLRQTFWIFFVIAVPLMALAVVVADLLHTKGRLRRLWRRWKRRE